MDQDGVVWATLPGRPARPGSTARLGGVVRIVGDRVELLHQTSGDRRISWGMQDAEGGVWISVHHEGWRRHDPSGTLTLWPVSHTSMNTMDPIVAPDGQLWRAESRFPSSANTGPNGMIYRGREQILALESEIIHFGFDDRGNLWVGTETQGLFRLRRSFLRTVSLEEGLPSRDVYPMLEDARGDFWVGTRGGGIAHLDATLRPIPTAGGEGLPVAPTDVLSLHMDRTGTLWVGKFTWVCQVQGARCEDVVLPLPRPRPTVRAMHEDRQGRFWIGGDFGLVLGRPEGAAWRWAVPRWEGDVSPNVRTIAETRDGAVLFATQGAGLLAASPIGAVWQTYIIDHASAFSSP